MTPDLQIKAGELGHGRPVNRAREVRGRCRENSGRGREKGGRDALVVMRIELPVSPSHNRTIPLEIEASVEQSAENATELMQSE